MEQGKFIDLSGKLFGRWLVLEKSIKPEKVKNTYSYWLCECQCPLKTKKIISSQSLTTGDSTSCGCNRKEKNMLAEGEASFNRLFDRYVINAKNRNLSFNLSKEDFKKLSKQFCYYCGKEPEQIIKPRKANGAFVYNGVDRINSDLGYEIDNCVSCCGECNWRKNNSSQQEFYSWIDRVHAHIHRNDPQPSPIAVQEDSVFSLNVSQLS